MNILVCNAGSTSLKFKLFTMPTEQVLATGKVERVGSTDNAIFEYRNTLTGFTLQLSEQNIPTYTVGISQFLNALLTGEGQALNTIEEIERVGFKTVLAKNYYGIHELTDAVLGGMEAYLPVAPAHNRPYLDAIKQFKALLPNAVMVGAFETAFHTSIPPERVAYGIPAKWAEEYGIRRFGYHGASHSYIADVIADEYGGTGRLISCHLGGSGSLCAIVNGESVDTSFGLSLQTGIQHGYRTGDLDPYIFPYLLQKGLSVEDILLGLEKEGGMMGLSGISGDLRDIEEAAMQNNSRAQFALDVYCNGIVKYIGAFFAEIGGLDHLAFTGGVGEHSSIVRAIVCSQLSHLGVILDQEKNNNRPNKTGVWCISEKGSPVSIHIIPANEELGVARKTFSYSV